MINKCMQLFTNNKYTRIYNQIIDKAQKREDVNGYVEKHHIIPKSLNGTDDSDNIVILTAKEHFICHRLLVKMTTGINKRKMSLALHRMLTGNKERYRPSSRTYQMIKEEWNRYNHFNDPLWQQENGKKQKGKLVSEEARENMRKGWIKRRERGLLPTGKPHTDETKRKISQNRKGKCVGKDNPFFGKTHTTETKELFKTRPQNKTPPWIKIKKECPHCGKILDPGNFTRYHGDKCKDH